MSTLEQKRLKTIQVDFLLSSRPSLIWEQTSEESQQTFIVGISLPLAVYCRNNKWSPYTSLFKSVLSVVWEHCIFTTRKIKDSNFHCSHCLRIHPWILVRNFWHFNLNPSNSQNNLKRNCANTFFIHHQIEIFAILLSTLDFTYRIKAIVVTLTGQTAKGHWSEME